MAKNIGDIEEFYSKAYNLITIRNLKKFFYTMIVAFVLLRFIRLIKINFINLQFQGVLLLIEIILFGIVLFILYAIKEKLIYYIRKTKKNILMGHIWYLKLLDFLNMEVYNPSYLYGIYLLNFLYNFFMVLLSLLWFISLFFLIIFIVAALNAIWNSLYGNLDPSFFSFTFYLVLVFLALSMVIFNIFLSSLVKKRETYLFLYHKLQMIDNSQDKRLYFQNILLKCLRRYSLQDIPKNVRNFSKSIIRQISVYYENVALVLLKEDIVYNNLFPKLNQIIITNDYKGLFNHLKYMDQKCKKNQNYGLHANLLRSYNKHIDEKNLIDFSGGLVKIKVKSIDVGSFIKNVWFFFEKTRIGNIVLLIIMILFLLLLIKIGTLDPLFEVIGINQTVVKEVLLGKLPGM